MRRLRHEIAKVLLCSGCAWLMPDLALTFDIVMGPEVMSKVGCLMVIGALILDPVDHGGM